MNQCGDSIRVVHPLFPTEGDGSIPISPLHLEVGEISVERAQRLNESWHSVLPTTDRGNIDRNSHKVCYAAHHENRYYAVAIWTSPVAANRLADGGSMLELRRFAIAHDAPANTGSRLLKVMRHLIKKRFPDIARLISYQAVKHHAGTIYKAAGWQQASTTKNIDWSSKTRKRNPLQTDSDKIRWEIGL